MTTNNLYDIPDQVERRCAVFEIEKPNQKQRKKVIKFYLRKHQKSHSIDLDMATRNTDKLCTASIRRIIEKAITLANIKQESTITNELFEQALKKAKIIENMPWSRRIYKKIKPQSDGFHWLGLTVTGIGVAGGIVGLVYQIRTYGKTAESNEIAKMNLEIAKQSLEVAKNSNWWQKAQTVTQWATIAGGAAAGAGLFILKTLKQAES